MSILPDFASSATKKNGNSNAGTHARKYTIIVDIHAEVSLHVLGSSFTAPDNTPTPIVDTY